MRPNVVLTILDTKNIYHHVWKTVRSKIQCTVGLQSWGEGHKICPIVFLAFQTFSPELENKETSKYGSESFPYMVTYILCVENCQNFILTHSCLPIAGKLFYNVKKFHGPRIWECNINISMHTRRVKTVDCPFIKSTHLVTIV